MIYAILLQIFLINIQKNLSLEATAKPIKKCLAVQEKTARHRKIFNRVQEAFFTPVHAGEAMPWHRARGHETSCRGS